jgi:hypothetical protein
MILSNQSFESMIQRKDLEQGNCLVSMPGLAHVVE